MELEQVEQTKSPFGELKDQAKTDESNGKGFMKPGARSKPGRKSNAERARLKAEAEARGETKSEPQQKAQGIPTSEIVKPLVKLMSTAAEAWCEDQRAAMSAGELEAGANALGMLLDKWGPDMVTKWGPEIMCGMVFGQYGLRVYALKKLKAFEEMEKEHFAEKNEIPKEKQTPAVLAVQ